jgi:uncharacterized membrane protein YedE/YeeE
MTDVGPPLLGGALIGLSAGTLLLLTGKTAGVSGALEGVVLAEKGEWGWKLAFVAGLLGGGALMAALKPELFPSTSSAPLWTAVAAGLLVGVGTRVGGGCTSGHGVCGVGRLSKRSIVATGVFMAVGILVRVIL